MGRFYHQHIEERAQSPATIFDASSTSLFLGLFDVRFYCVSLNLRLSHVARREEWNPIRVRIDLSWTHYHWLQLFFAVLLAVRVLLLPLGKCIALVLRLDSSELEQQAAKRVCEAAYLLSFNASFFYLPLQPQLQS